MMNTHATMKAGRSSYIFHAPPSGRTRYFHINTMHPPETIPASAPHFVVRVQKSENSTTGPNTAPNPAHANETIVNTELSGSLAIIAATTAITNSVILATVNESSYFAATVTII